MLYRVFKPLLLQRSFCTNTRMHLDILSARVRDPKHAIINSWLQNHLFALGLDHIKLQAYKKLSSLVFQGGGGTIKNTVFEISLFVKREWTANSSLAQHISLPFSLETSAKIPGFKLFYVSIGYMLLTEREEHVESLINDVFELYLIQGGSQLSLNVPTNKLERRVCKITKRYYTMVKIDYQKLYKPSLWKRWITIGENLDPITLPPLPQIKSKQLLAKALLHKELFRAFEHPNHFFRKTLENEGLEVSPSILKIIRYDLLFLDGLGDFFLAKESSEFLYKFRQSHPFSDDDSFGKKTYHLLKTILATNTLLLKLAIAYNLHSALDDPIVKNILHASYIPNIITHPSDEDTLLVRYEEEFVADYFEQYVGALYVEQPQVAKEWINNLFKSILSLINDSYMMGSPRRKKKARQYNYRAWSADIIGRSI